MTVNTMRGAWEHARVGSTDARLDFARLLQRVEQGRNPSGAAYRLCALTRPATVTELCTNARVHGLQITPERTEALIDGYLQWVDAGKPPAVHV